MQLDPERSLNRVDTEKPSEVQPVLRQQDLQKLERSHQLSQHQAFRFILTQALVTIVLSAGLLMVEQVVAYSSLAGGLIAILANAWFALKVFRVKPTVAADALLSAIYVGEIYKFVLTAAMFVIAFVLIEPISVAALLLTYLLIHMIPAVHNAFVKDQYCMPKSH